MRIDLILFGTVGTAHAQLSGIANAVSNGLVPFFFGDGEGGTGADAYAGIVGFILERAWLVVGIFALLLLVRSGIKLIYGQSEEKFEEAKRAIANGLMAVVLTYLVSRMVSAFIRLPGFRFGGTMTPGDAALGAGIFTQEILGIVSWVQTLVAVLAVGMIIAAVFTAMFSIGGEDGPAKIRRSVFGAAAGIIILLLDGAFRLMFGLAYNTVPTLATDPDAIILPVITMIGNILLFLALVAVIVVIYAGIMMILSLGNEEQFKKMKTLIVRALIGLTVILFSFVIVRLVVTIFFV